MDYIKEETIKSSLLQPIKIDDDFFSVISSRLCLLDDEVVKGKSSSNKLIRETDDSALKNAKNIYFNLLKSFSYIEEINETVFVYSLAIAKRVKNIVKNKFSFKPLEFLKVFIGCLFLSIKYVVDTHSWFIDDFSSVSGIEKNIIEKMENFVLMDILNFRFYISD